LPRPPTAGRRQGLNQRSLHLAYVTAGYHLVEGIVAVVAIPITTEHVGQASGYSCAPGCTDTCCQGEGRQA
jgi:hypothetical protein